MRLVDEMMLGVAHSPALAQSIDFALSRTGKLREYGLQGCAAPAEPASLRLSRELLRVPLIRLLLVLVGAAG